MTGLHKYLKLGSQGSANSAQPIGMGVYFLTNDQYNKFPVYKMVGVEEYIFVDKSGCWSIYTETHPSMKGLYHPQRNPTPPEPPLTGWSYVNLLGEWKTDDPTLMLEKLPGVYDASVGLQEFGPPEYTPLPKGSFWEKYISSFSMTDREVLKPAG